MIETMKNFIERFKSVCDTHTDCYLNESQSFVGWTRADFDTSKITEEMAKTRQIFPHSQVKKLYDVVKTYKRTYMVYNRSRDDYYRDAIHERDRDKFIVDKVINTTLDTYTSFLGIEK